MTGTGDKLEAANAFLPAPGHLAEIPAARLCSQGDDRLSRTVCIPQPLPRNVHSPDIICCDELY